MIKKLFDRFFESLEQGANLNKVLRDGGLKITGEWKSKKLCINDQELDIHILNKNKVKHSLVKFHWGDDSKESRTTALAILLWFLPRTEALNTRDIFFRDFVSQFKNDFDIWFEYEYWRNRRSGIDRKFKRKPIDTDGYGEV